MVENISVESHCDSRTPNTTRTQGNEITPESISGNVYPEVTTHTQYCTELFKESRNFTQVCNQDVHKKCNAPHRIVHLEKLKETMNRHLKPYLI